MFIGNEKDQPWPHDIELFFHRKCPQMWCCEPLPDLVKINLKIGEIEKKHACMIPEIQSADRQKHYDQKIKIISRENAQCPAEQEIKCNIHFGLPLLQANLFCNDQYFGDQVTTEH